MIEMDDQVLGYRRVRAAHAEWCELFRAVDRCARALEAQDEDAQARALRVDLGHLVRRAQLHLKQLAAREAALGVGRSSSRPPAASGEPQPP